MVALGAIALALSGLANSTVVDAGQLPTLDRSAKGQVDQLGGGIGDGMGDSEIPGPATTSRVPVAPSRASTPCR